MVTVLGGFGTYKGGYERPTQRWVCGRLAAGGTCRVGPDKRGNCQATFECAPSQVGGEWRCRRAPSSGGPCEQGPDENGQCCRAIPPCTPHLSMRAKRGAAAFWTGMVTIGFLILAITYSGDADVLMPGPMSSAHSTVEECSTCHSNVTENRFSWLRATFAPAKPHKDSRACLTCHEVGKKPLNPHGLEVAALNERTYRLRDLAAATPKPVSAHVRGAVLPVSSTFAKGVFCASCHDEHRGEQGNLTSVPDARCQTCHTIQFDRFQNGHPEFSTYPFQRRTRIAFDHVKHFGDNFPKTRKENDPSRIPPGACVDCHTAGAKKRRMDVKPFAETCSACHLGQIVGNDRTTGHKGVSLLTLPGVDVATLAEKNVPIGEWPEASEAEITPLMKLLIGRDKDRRDMLATVSELDLLDLTEASEEEIAAVMEFVWEVKELFYALATWKGSDALQRLSWATGEEIRTDLIDALTASLPRDVLISARRDWLPSLEVEVARHRRGEKVSFVNPVISGDEPATEGAPEAASDDEEDSSDEGSEDILSGDESDDEGENAEEGESDNLSGGDEEISTDEDTLSLGASDEADAAAETDGADDAGETTEEAASEDDNPRPLPDAETWAEFGGWYRKDYAVLYKPKGHADPFMRAWLDFTGGMFAKDESKLAAPAFEALTSKEAQGKCTKCHSIDKQESGSRKVNWGPAPTNRLSEHFTSFSHEPHFGLFGDKGCLTCHEMNPKADSAKTYKGFDPKVFDSNFKPVVLKTCTQCHEKNVAGEDCQQCHVYHADGVTSPLTITKIPK